MLIYLIYDFKSQFSNKFNKYFNSILIKTKNSATGSRTQRKGMKTLYVTDTP